MLFNAFEKSLKKFRGETMRFLIQNWFRNLIVHVMSEKNSPRTLKIALFNDFLSKFDKLVVEGQHALF